MSPNTNGTGIKTARLKAGRTQVELADGVGVSERTVMRWELGRTLPDTGQIGRVWEFLKSFVPALRLEELLPNARMRRRKRVTRTSGRRASDVRLPEAATQEGK